MPKQPWLIQSECRRYQSLISEERRYQVIHFIFYSQSKGTPRTKGQARYKECQTTLTPGTPPMLHTVVQPTSLVEPQCIDQLRLEINYILDEGNQTILLDCCKIEAINSSSLGILVALLKQAKRHNAEIILCSLNAQFQHVLKLSLLDDFFKFCNAQEFEERLISI